LYIVLQGIDTANANAHNANRTVIVQVLVNPMVGFIWLGGIVIGLGGFAALVPARRRRRVAVTAAEPVRLQPEEVPL
jgi:cytochrome c biogenesis factor